LVYLKNGFWREPLAPAGITDAGLQVNNRPRPLGLSPAVGNVLFCKRRRHKANVFIELTKKGSNFII